MPTRKSVFAVWIFSMGMLAAASAPAAQTQGVALTGTVTDPAGKPVAGATVTLVGQSLSAKTDANGKYSLIRIGTGLGGIGSVASGSRASGAPSSAPIWNLVEGGLRFQAPGVGRAEGAYSPTGRWTGLAHTGFAPLPGAGDASGRDDAAHTVDAPTPPFARSKSAASTTATAPTAGAGSAAADSLDVLAIGFQREGRSLAAPSGTHDFKLKALSYANVAYKSGPDLSVYEKQRCFLDVHVPAGPARKYPVIVHLHGGGLQGGDKAEGWSANDKNNYVRKVSDQGFIVVAVNYRLGIDPDLPDKGGLRGKYPDYLKDAAAAIAWTKRNVEPYGGDTANFFVMGYSAGAWLGLMMVMDTTFYRDAGFDAKAVSGYICLSAQTYTYGEYAIEQNISDRGISVAAALHFVRKIEAPVHLFVGGLETQRLSDNNVFLKAMKDAGTTSIQLSVMPGRDHEQLVSAIGNAVDETRTRILEFIKSRTVLP